MKSYQVLVSQETFDQSSAYLEKLRTGKSTGSYLQSQLCDQDIFEISNHNFIELLLRTKRPRIFAESAVYGDGTDWTQEELAILGDISIAIPVTVYDDAKHRQPTVHSVPLLATLLFTPGALLRNGQGIVPVDWEAVVSEGEVDPVKYYRLYERRLLPAFMYADQMAKSRDKMAVITIPGLGCGQFAGRFAGQLGSKLKDVLITFLETHGRKFSNIKVVYYDPYRECENERQKIEEISFFVRPLTLGNEHKPQLCNPIDYAETGDNFSNCELFSFVAWDHVSWPGNDFYMGARVTDDGVKAAATDTMMVMTGIAGNYNDRIYQYSPPAEYSCWREVVLRNQIKLDANENLTILG
jgi:hypothetical protein